MALTLQQENELRKAVGLEQKSAAVDYAVPRAPRMTDDQALDAMFKDAGADIEGVQQQVQAEQNKARQDRYQAFQKEMDAIDRERMMGKVKENAAEVALGVGLGFRDIARNTYNGVVSLADSAENFAAKHGIGSGDLISEANKWKDEYGQQVAQSLDTTGNVARSVTNFAAPLLATVASGGGFAAGMGVNAAYNFLAIDPKQSRLSDHLKNTFLNEVPIASDVIDYLSTKPDDTELEARFKNLAEGAGIDVAVGGMLWGASRAYTGIKGLRSPKMIEAAEKEVSAAKNSVQATPVTPAEQAALNASDEALSTATPAASAETGSIPIQNQRTAHVADTPEQLDLFEKQWAQIDPDQPAVYTKPDTGEVRIRLANDEILDRFYNMSQQVDQNVLRTPMTDAEVREAADIMKNDSATVDRLAKWTPDQGVPTDKETLVLKYVMSQGDESMREAIAVVAQNPDDDLALIKFTRELQNYQRLAEIRQGTASAKGATLRVEKVVGALARTGDKEALAALGAQGRAKLAQGLIEEYGGKANIQKMVSNMEFLSRMSAITEVPNSDFAFRMGDVIQKSKWMRFEDAVTKVALNGMLSSPMTSMKAVLTNMVTTGKTVIDNYFSVGAGQLMNQEGARTLAEANAHLKGVMSGLLEGIQPAWQVMREGEVTRLTRMDLTEGVQKIVNQDDAFFQGAGAWAAKTGARVDAAVGLPTRVLMGVDTYWQMVNYKGVVNSEAVRQGLAKGLDGKDLTAFIEQFVAKPPASVDYAATQIAQTNTMAKQLSGFAESIDNVIDQGSQYIPFARVVLPFFKTNMNLVEYTVKNSPLAPMLSQDFRTAISQGGRARDEAVARVISGSAILGGFVALANSDMISGRGTDNPEIARALKDNKTVAPPTSIKIGDKWVSIQGMEPVSTFVNMAAMISKAGGYIGEQEYAEAATAMAIMASEVATPEAMTDSLSGLLNVLSATDDKSQKEALNYLQTIPTRFMPFGAAITDVRQTIDPTIRATRGEDFLDTMQNRFSNMIPWLSKDLPAERNIWGEKLVMPDGIGPDAISPMATTSDEGMALKRAMERMNDYYETTKDTNMGLTKFDISMPPRSIKNPMAGVNYQLSAQEYSAYVVLSAGINPTTGQPLMNDGRTLKKVVTDIVTKYDGYNKRPQDYDPRTYANMVGELSKAFSSYKQVADKLILQFGDVGNKMKMQADKYKTFEETQQ